MIVKKVKAIDWLPHAQIEGGRFIVKPVKHIIITANNVEILPLGVQIEKEEKEYLLVESTHGALLFYGISVQLSLKYIVIGAKDEMQAALIISNNSPAQVQINAGEEIAEIVGVEAAFTPAYEEAKKKQQKNDKK